ncbi:hypothetical protein M0R45_023771 [Rubus argutus]|uniref:Uncharacterized protein n=1 Tax=Rubus argutus TaxID=59490 RepID=A0AAW1WQI7_RUBAR
MDAHLRYFKQGYELLHTMEPYIHQVCLDYVQQTRESTNQEQISLNERILEDRSQIDRESRQSLSGVHGSPSGDGSAAYF